MHWALSVLLVVVTLLLVAYLWTFRTTPHVSVEQIEADGGRSLPLADGRVIEFFEYGAPASSEVLVLFHGYTLSGAAAASWHDECARRNVRVIGLSMAGWGASSPLRGRSYVDAGLDALQVLRHLGFNDSQPLHIVGISFGAGNAAALAALCGRRVHSLSLLVPAWPSMHTHDMWSNTAFVHWLVGQPFFDRIWQYYVAPKLDIPKLLSTLAPKDWVRISLASCSKSATTDWNTKHHVFFFASLGSSRAIWIGRTSLSPSRVPTLPRACRGSFNARRAIITRVRVTACACSAPEAPTLRRSRTHRFSLSARE